MRAEAKPKDVDASSEGLYSERSGESTRLDLNDLLRRNKETRREDRKTNLLIISLTAFIASAAVLILIFS